MAGTTVNPYRFGGQAGYRRDGTNRNYVRARELDTQRGRWVSRDPIGFDSGDENLYRYVGNDAPNAVDPSGLVPSPVCLVPCAPCLSALIALGFTCGIDLNCIEQTLANLPPTIKASVEAVCDGCIECLTDVPIPLPPIPCPTNPTSQTCKDVCPWPKCINPNDPGTSLWNYRSMDAAVRSFCKGEFEGWICNGQKSPNKRLLPCKQYGRHQNVFRKRNKQQNGMGKNVGSAFCCDTCQDTPNGPVLRVKYGTR
jgi:RHS repeat-associated protein